MAKQSSEPVMEIPPFAKLNRITAPPNHSAATPSSTATPPSAVPKRRHKAALTESSILAPSTRRGESRRVNADVVNYVEAVRRENASRMAPSQRVESAAGYSSVESSGSGYYASGSSTGSGYYASGSSAASTSAEYSSQAQGSSSRPVTASNVRKETQRIPEEKEKPRKPEDNDKPRKPERKEEPTPDKDTSTGTKNNRKSGPGSSSSKRKQ